MDGYKNTGAGRNSGCGKESRSENEYFGFHTLNFNVFTCRRRPLPRAFTCHYDRQRGILQKNYIKIWYGADA